MTVDPQIASELFSSFVSQSPLWFGSNAGVVSVNTQARRLGCLIYILGQVKKGRRIESMLLALPSKELAELKRNLLEYGFKSGYLTAKGSSVKHYLDAAVECHLLVRQGAVLHLTQLGKFLLEAVCPTVECPYPLSVATRIFFLHTLLGIDYFGITAIVRSLQEGARRLSVMEREHRAQLLRLLGEASHSSPNTRFGRAVKDRIISIENWRNPESYSEHLVSAKLNWLVDLGILEGVSANSEIRINRAHEDWLKNLAQSTTPTESHLLTFALSYALACRENGQATTEDDQICVALGRAFEHLAGSKGLKKIRCSDFLLFAVCFHGPMLATAIEQRKKLLGDSSVVCGGIVYDFQFASRPTQSFILQRRRIDN